MKNKISLVVSVALLISLLSATAAWAAPVLSNSGFETGNLCTPPPSGMVSWWPGDGNANDIQDGNSPTQTIGTPQFITAKVSQGMKFDGASGFVVPNSANLNFGANGSFTLDAWVRIDGISSVGDDALVDKRDRPGTAYLLDLIGPPFIAGRLLRFSINDGSNVVIARTSLIPDNNFHLVAGVVDRNASTLSIYLDGVLQQSLSISNVGNISDSARLFIGHQSLDAPLTRLQPFNGVIDELEIINRALTASEIQAIFNAGSAGKCKTPPNQSPTASAGVSYQGSEGIVIAMSGATASDPDGDPLTYAWSVNSALCTFDDASTLNPNLTCTDNGNFIVKLEVSDGVNPPVTSEAAVSVTNVVPTASFGNDGPIDEGGSATVSFSGAFDPSSNDTAAGFHYAFDCSGGSLSAATYASSGTSDSTSCAFADNGSYTVSGKIMDKDDGSNEYTTTVTVNNVAPTLGAISVDQALVPVNTAINASASFTDPGTLDTHTAVWDWGDGTTAGTVTQGAGFGSVNDSHSYSTPGVYTIKLIVTDNDGAPSNESVYQFVVVYDPSGGFVTGGGWINSPAGAYVADPFLTGKANFGFVAKYKMGANVPDGNTEFQFKAGDLNFHSSSYQWLVVAGARAQFKGEGTINGAGHYGFMLTAIDGQINGGGGVDKFRIKIWDMDNGDTVVYDNLMSGADAADPTTALGGGSIVIHK